MANTTIGTLAISVKANVGKAIAGFKSANKQIEIVAKTVADATRKFAAMSLAVTSAGAAIGTAMVRSSLQTVDALAKMSSRLGIATEDLIGLRYAAGLSGVGVSQLEMGLQRMTRRIAEAAMGTGEAVGALETLGLSAQTLSGMSPDEQFRAVADAMQQINGRSEQVRLAFKLFDSEGVALINTLKGGSEALRETQKEAEALGLTFSNIDAAQIEAANDSVSKLQAAFKGVSDQVTIGLAPALDGIARSLTSSFKNIKKDIDLSSESFKWFVNIMGLGADALHFLKIGWKTVQAVSSDFITEIVRGLMGLSGALDDVLEAMGVGATGITENLQYMSRALAEETTKSYEELADLWNAPLPGMQIEEQLKRWGAESRNAAMAAGELQKNSEEAAKAIAKIEPPKKTKKVVDNIAKSFDEMADSLLQSLKSPQQLLLEFIIQLENLGDRLTKTQKDQLIANRSAELLAGDSRIQAQNPAALQQGTAEARSAEIQAINRLTASSEERQRQQKLQKETERLRREAEEQTRLQREIAQSIGFQIVTSSLV